MLEAIEAFAPEGAVKVEPVNHGGEGVGVGAVVGFTAVTAKADELGRFEDGEVLGDGGLGDSGGVSQGMDGLLAVAGELLEDGAPGRVGEGAKDGIGSGCFHAKTITIWLWVCQAQRLGMPIGSQGDGGLLLVDSCFPGTEVEGGGAGFVAGVDVVA